MAKCPKCGKKSGFLGGWCDECSAEHDRAAGQAAATEQAAVKEKAEELTAAFRTLTVQTTTAFAIPGFRIVRSFGMVRGICVRSPKIGQGFVASLETIGGGENSALTQMCEDTRETALRRMWEHAHTLGANAVIGSRYDANEVAAGITEVICYGTAVQVEQHAEAQ